MQHSHSCQHHSGTSQTWNADMLPTVTAACCITASTKPVACTGTPCTVLVCLIGCFKQGLPADLCGALLSHVVSASWLDPTDGDLATITRFGASNNCSMPCTGGVTTRCGGDFTVDMYTITDLLPATIPEHNVTFLGCFR